jgi:hypothetical protein
VRFPLTVQTFASFTLSLPLKFFALPTNMSQICLDLLSCEEAVLFEWACGKHQHQDKAVVEEGRGNILLVQPIAQTQRPKKSACCVVWLHPSRPFSRQPSELSI